MFKMVLKQKIYNFLATVSDYKGLHYTADAYRKGDENITWAIIDLLFICPALCKSFL